MKTNEAGKAAQLPATPLKYIEQVDPELGEALWKLNTGTSKPDHFDYAEIVAVEENDPALYKAWRKIFMKMKFGKGPGGSPWVFGHVEEYDRGVADKLRAFDRAFTTEADVVDQWKVDQLSPELQKRVPEAIQKADKLESQQGIDHVMGITLSSGVLVGAAFAFPVLQPVIGHLLALNGLISLGLKKAYRALGGLLTKPFRRS